MKIGEHTIGRGHRPFIIAEMSGNHNQSFNKAVKILEAASQAGAHAVKLQTYRPDTITMDVEREEFFISDEDSLWSGRSLYSLYKEAHTPWEWHAPLFEKARQLGLAIFSTPFDDTAVDFLEQLDTPCYKIASFENVDIPLIRKVAETGKPMIISTGMASISELDEAVRAAKKHGCGDIALLKCTSAYPAPPEDANLLTIPHMRELFQCEVGISDHTMGVGASIAAVALGATIIEKHITLDRNEPGVDAAFSIEPHELRNLVKEAGTAWKVLGGVQYGPTEKERASLKFRRSLYIAKDMKKGDLFSEETIKSVRPGLGLAPKHLPVIIGKKAIRNIKKGTPLSWELIG